MTSPLLCRCTRRFKSGVDPVDHSPSNRSELPPRFAPFIDEIRVAVRARHYSYRTEQTCVGWITHFVAYAAPEKRQDLHPSQAKDYLNYLSVVRRVSSATERSLNTV